MDSRDYAIAIGVAITAYALTVAILFGIRGWEQSRTPIPDVIREAFDGI